MKPDLLGYLLHSLEPIDERAAEEFLEANPSARRELGRLRKRLSPLDAWGAGEPPDDLFYKTLRGVARLKRATPSGRCADTQPNSSTIPQLEPWQPNDTLEAGHGSWRRADVWISVTLILLVLIAVPPALRYVRELSARVECRDNMRHFSSSISEFAKNNDGYIPKLALDGPLAHAGVYASFLRAGGYWGDEMRMGCREGVTVLPATLDEIKSHDPNDHGWWTRFGGSYGYNLGYIERNGERIRVIAIRRADGDGIPILADRPPRPGEVPNWTTANSPLHGGVGQNVMYNGGHVLFQTTRRGVLGDDPDIFSNQYGLQAAGFTPRDAVIGPSEAKPVPPGSVYPSD